MAAEKAQGLICGWPIHSMEGGPMKMGGRPALALDRARHVVDLNLPNNCLVPKAAEPQAAIGDFDADTGNFTLTIRNQNLCVARPGPG